MTTHLPYEDMAPVYALDALEPGETAEFETHLAGCAECTARVAAYRQTAGELAGLAGERAPSEALKARIMRVAGSREPWSPGLRPPLLYPVAAALAVLLLSVAGLAFWLFRAESRADREAASSAYSYDALALLARADRRWDLAGTPQAPGTRGVLAFSTASESAVLVLWDVVDEPGASFNAWVRQDGRRVSAGRMRSGDDGLWRIIRLPPEGIQGVGITRVSPDGTARVDLIDFLIPE